MLNKLLLLCPFWLWYCRLWLPQAMVITSSLEDLLEWWGCSIPTTFSWSINMNLSAAVSDHYTSPLTKSKFLSILDLFWCFLLPPPLRILSPNFFTIFTLVSCYYWYFGMFFVDSYSLVWHRAVWLHLQLTFGWNREKLIIMQVITCVCNFYVIVSNFFSWLALCH